MSKTGSATKIKLNSFDDLFGLNESMTEAGDVRYVELSELHSFKGHPFKVQMDVKMEELIASIKTYGVLSPGVARIRANGGYEIISGHRRKYACEKAGISVMPMFIRNVSDDEATVLMVDANIQREDILPSEKAWAYKLKYDAIKHQGKKGNSLKALEESSGDNTKTIQRYIQLTKLIPALLQRIDDKKLGFIPGVRLAELDKPDQKCLDHYLENNSRIRISVKQAKSIVDASDASELSEEILDSILKPESDKEENSKITLNMKYLQSYFPPAYSLKEMKDVIDSLLTEWKKSEKGGE